MGSHELPGQQGPDHAGLAIAAAGRNEKHSNTYEAYGQPMHEAPGQGPRFYDSYGQGGPPMYGNGRYEAASNEMYEAPGNTNMRYGMGPDRRLHELDASGRRY